MSGDSSVGNAAVYEAGDQRNAPNAENQTERFEEGKQNSHQENDSSSYLPSPTQILSFFISTSCNDIFLPSQRMSAA